MSNGIKRIACVAENCGTFPVDRELYEKLKRTGDTFSCPEGHEQYFTKTILDEKNEEIQALREEIAELQTRIETLEYREGRFKERSKKAWDDYLEERERRRVAERVLLRNVVGIVEVGPGEYKWSCGCGNRGQKAFESAEAAREAYRDHQRRQGCVTEAAERVVEA